MMVDLSIVEASNARLRKLGPGLVALFVGGTSGIGEFTLKAFVQHTVSPRVYIVGRSGPAAERIIKECEALNKDGKVEFLAANVTELSEVDKVCMEIEKKENKINLIVQTQGNLTLAGRQESPEGIDRKFTLNFYSRMRFIHNLLPLLRNATASEPHFARTLSVLGAGAEGAINLDDLELKNTYSGPRCANHTIVMNDFMTGEFASRDPEISFVHSFPGTVNTGLARELPWWLRAPLKVLTPLLSLLLMVPAHETGQRQLFIATNGIYPPARPVRNAKYASGVPAPAGVAVLPGSNKKVGSGGYVVNWNCEPTGKKVLDEYREKGVSKIIWEHTMGIFDRVEKINKGRDLSGNA